VPGTRSDDAQRSEATAAPCAPGATTHQLCYKVARARAAESEAARASVVEALVSGVFAISFARSTTFANARAKQKRACTRFDSVPPPSECGEKVEGRDMTPLPRK